jgi:hypothetical protein
LVVGRTRQPRRATAGARAAEFGFDAHAAAALADPAWLPGTSNATDTDPVVRGLTAAATLVRDRRPIREAGGADAVGTTSITALPVVIARYARLAT